MINALILGLALSASGQVSLDQIQTIGASSPTSEAPTLVASFDAASGYQPAPPPPNPVTQGPLPGAQPGSPPGTPGGPPAETSTTCPPAAASVRPEWLQPGTCGGCFWLDGDCWWARFFKQYYDAFNPSGEPAPEEAPAQRRALPEAWPSPPFPSHEFQGYPLVGVPISPHTSDPLMASLKGTWLGDWLIDNRIDVYGWLTGEYNYSTSQHTNQPDSYWIVPNRAELDQAVLRFERQADMVQTDHWDWGFRFTSVYGMDYRYLTSGGWFSQQALLENQLYGYDPTEVYAELYIPGVAQGMVIRVGRWIACPDIETQFAPDNYMGTHSLLFTFDTYTQTGVMLSWCLNEQWMIQCAITPGTDMAPWYP
ncbi:MAG TPA: outer membrane beta-barrel protein, partial [Planctomycetaceae bacterium]|nr:outer membrane beta-barrel protein [Planctomycetaceae bacterium]